MTNVRINKTVVENAKPSITDVVVHDAELRGFQLRVTPKGKRVFYVYYRTKGAALQQRRYKIGDYPKISAHRAREIAHEILGKVASGGDPSADRKKERNKLNCGRFNEIAEQFLAKHALKNRSGKETERIFRHNILPTFGKRSIHEITRSDVAHFIRKIADTAPTMANRVLAAIRKFFNWCYANSIIESSPAEGVAAPSREISRDRLLEDSELKAVVLACREMGYPYGALVELLAITGQRREEVAAMEWNEIDFQKSAWTIPAARSKNGKAHIVHLSALAMRILKDAPVAGQFVFSTTGNTPFQGFSKAKTRLDEKSGVNDWRLHDLRRTFASGMARLGIAPHIADKILNHQAHTLSSTAAVYQKHAFLDERREAIECWSNHIDSLMKRESDAMQEAA